MKKIYLFCLLLLCNFICFFGQANPISEKLNSTLSVEQAYIRATIPGASNSSAYMVIENKGEIEILAIGIGHDVSRYYNKAIKITDVQELGDVMINQLSGLFDNKKKLH